MLANRTCTRTRKRAHAHKRGIRGIKNSICCLRSNRVGKLCRTHEFMYIKLEIVKCSLQNKDFLHFI